jgi:hypothetical protein
MSDANPESELPRPSIKSSRVLSLAPGRELMPGALSRAATTPMTTVYAQNLRQQVQNGFFADALSELAHADLAQLDEHPLLRGLHDAVVTGLTRDAAAPHDELAPHLLGALSIVPLACEHIIVDTRQHMHLMYERKLDYDNMGETLTTACGKTLSAPVEQPLPSALRGAWESPLLHGYARCADCEPHADEFPETAYPGETWREPIDKGVVLQDEVTARVQQRVLEAMPELLALSSDDAVTAAHDFYEEEMATALGTRMAAGGEPLVRRVARNFYEEARTAMTELGQDGPLVDLFDDEAWYTVAWNALEDIDDEDGPAIAESYLYLAVRSTLTQHLDAVRHQQSAE